MILHNAILLCNSWKRKHKSLPRIVFLLSLKYFCHFYRVLVSKTKLACFLQCRHYAIVLFHFLAYPDQTSVSLDFFWYCFRILLFVIIKISHFATEWYILLKELLFIDTLRLWNKKSFKGAEENFLKYHIKSISNLVFLKKKFDQNFGRFLLYVKVCCKEGRSC